LTFFEFWVTWRIITQTADNAFPHHKENPMLQYHINHDELARMLSRHPERPAWPGLGEPAAKRRAKRYLKTYGGWEILGRKLDVDPEIPVLRRSLFRDFVRNGNRTRYQQALAERQGRLADTALALWLGHPAADLDRLQDLLWAYCESWSWILPAHEHCRGNDLVSAMTGAKLAETVWLLRDKLEDEVIQRVRDCIRERVLDPGVDYRLLDCWKTGTNNWNHVCNASLIITALYLLENAECAAYIAQVLPRLAYAFDAFTPDGGCAEGPNYWNFGFGNYMDAAIALHYRTDGALNLMDDPLIKRICRFPLAVHMTGAIPFTYCDSHGHDAYLAVENALKVNWFYKTPALFDCVRQHEDGTPVLSYSHQTTRHLQSKPWRPLTLYRKQKAKGDALANDAWLPDLGVATVRAQSGKRRVVLSAIGAHNGMPHGHNHVGSFKLLRNDTAILTDPGAPVYRKDTFGSQRYTILACRSRGHSVPLIEGREQPEGKQYHGELSVVNPDENGEKRIVIDLCAAYAVKSLRMLTRTLTLTAKGTLLIEDTYAFHSIPKQLEEAFVTFEPAKLQRDGSVRIGTGRNTAALRTIDTSGTFRVEELAQESAEAGWDDTPLKRIVFTPARLNKGFALRFEVKP